MPDVTFFCDWDVNLIEQTQDALVTEEAHEFKEQLDIEWKLLLTHLIKYIGEVFEAETLDKALFKRLYAQVCTRCFGWGLPCTAMVPAADNFNHSDVTVIQELINIPLHLEKDEESSYYTRTKFMNDYTDLFKSKCPEKLESATEEEKKNVEGHINREKYA